MSYIKTINKITGHKKVVATICTSDFATFAEYKAARNELIEKHTDWDNGVLAFVSQVK